MFNVVILEDEAINRRLLRQLVVEYINDVSIVAECTTVQEAYNEIKKHDRLIILLDIELGTFENGFDLIRLIENRKDAIIVISAFPEYAIKAFRLDVVDFVTKPIRISELVGAFDRVKKKTVVAHGTEKTAEDRLIGIQLFNKTTFYKSEDITLIKSDLSGTRIFLNTGMSINSIERIGQIEARLDKLAFSRIDKSQIINLSYIKSYSINNGQLLLAAQNGSLLIVSRRKKSTVIQQLKSYFKQ